jgi:hypothetical protein
MKFIQFPEQNNKIDDFGFYASDNGSIICLELTKDELIKLKDRGGKIWIKSTMKVPPPIALTLDHPFKKQIPEDGKGKA